MRLSAKLLLLFLLCATSLILYSLMETRGFFKLSEVIKMADTNQHGSTGLVGNVNSSNQNGTSEPGSIGLAGNVNSSNQNGTSEPGSIGLVGNVNSNNQNGTSESGSIGLVGNVNSNNQNGTSEMTSQGPIKVIVVTYMRSGSSLTGHLLAQHPSVFYLYEPLWNIMQMYYRKSPAEKLRFLDKSTQEIPGSVEEVSTQKLKIISNYLDCSFPKVDIVSLTQHHMMSSSSTQGLYRCAKNQKKNFPKLVECLKPLTDKCEKSAVRLVKTIRMSMQNVSILLKSDPRLKVIHLIRDPRGTVLSQRTVGEFRHKDVPNAARKLCGQIGKDIDASRAFSKEFSNRILTVRYEDITDSPVEVTRQMYKFLDLNLSRKIQAHIWNITYGGLPNNCNICTTRTNASQTASKWRQNLSFKTTKSIQKQCRRVFKVMGYKLFNNENVLRNENVSPKRSEYSPDLMKVQVSTSIGGTVQP